MVKNKVSAHVTLEVQRNLSHSRERRSIIIKNQLIATQHCQDAEPILPSLNYDQLKLHRVSLVYLRSSQLSSLDP